MREIWAMALLTGKVAIVTGAGRGLGRCHALALAAHGASVVVNDLGGSVTGGAPSENGEDAAAAVVAEITAAGGRAMANRASVADWAGARSIIDDAIAAFGGLDIVVNNAGINRPASLIDLTEAGAHVERELALVKVAGTGEARVEALRLADVFRASVVDTTTSSFIFELTGAPDKIDRFVSLMRELGLVEVGRTGVVGMMRGAEAV